MNVYKSVWISDIHLGTKGCKADQLCAFLKETQCESLFLVGDIVDGWRLSKSWYWPQEHSNVVRRLLTKAKRGTHIIYVTGNHDEFLRPWVRHIVELGNIQVVNKYIYKDIKQRDWLITHGDLFDQVTRHWRYVSLLGDRAYTLLLSLNGAITKVRSFMGLGYWSLSKFIKGKTKQALNFVYKFEEHLAAHAKAIGVQGVICGHIHTPTIKNISGIIYINDGDWVESCSAVVETLEGDFKLLILDTEGTMREVQILT